MELSSFIGAVEWSEFRNCFQTRQLGARFVTPDPQRFRSLWSEWELSALCRLSRAPQDEGFRLFTRGRMVLRDAYLDKTGVLREEVMQKLWASGVSITVRRVEDYSNRVLALARSLEAALGCPVQVNLYMTPGEGQALGAHFDDHDVLVLQIQGRKTWEIYPRTDGTGGTADPATPVVNTLEAGGWLYVPKGIRHEVRNKAAEPSIHFTISFHPLTWGRMIQDGLNAALERAPSLEARCPAGEPVAAEEIGRRLAVVQSFVESPEKYYGGFRALKVAVPATALADRATLEAAEATTPFLWRAGEVEVGGAEGELNLGYRRHPLLLWPEFGAVLRQMAQRGAFRPVELDGLPPEAALLLCKLLANVGVLGLAVG